MAENVTAQSSPDALLAAHLAEWEENRALFRQALEGCDQELAKLVKLLAETIKIRREGERRVMECASAAQNVETEMTIHFVSAPETPQASVFVRPSFQRPPPGDLCL